MALTKQKVENLVLMYESGQQKALIRLIDDFSVKAKSLGATLRISEFHDV
jgi:hypothetical protein